MNFHNGRELTNCLIPFFALLLVSACVTLKGLEFYNFNVRKTKQFSLNKLFINNFYFITLVVLCPQLS